MVNSTLHLQHNATNRQFAYSLDSSTTGFHVVYALIQLYTYSKNSMNAIDMAAVRIARCLLMVTIVEVSSRQSG